MIYTLTLNPALDYDVYLDDIKLGELNLSNSTNFRAGGKGINVSLMLNNLGISSTALGFVAGFTGEYILNYLKDVGINQDFIKIKGTTRINVKIKDSDKETEIAGISPIIDEESLNELYTKLKTLTKEDILVLSGSIPESLSKELYYNISEITEAKLVLDTRGSILMENINNNLLIKPNIHELEDVFSTKIENFDDIYKYSQEFIKKGVSYVMVSMGSKGACLVTKDRLYYASVPKGNLVNSIGAGDSTVAGFIYAHINNLSDVDKLKLSISCGSATAYSLGIGSKEQVDKLLSEISVKEYVYGN